MPKKVNTKKHKGEENYNKFGSLMIIQEYINSSNVIIYFPKYDWSTKTTYDYFKKGKPVCPYEPRVFGIGYIGVGPYASKINGKTTLEYNTWSQMLRRCYDSNSRTKYPSYKDCTVVEEWLNFQTFAQWFTDNYYEVLNEEMHLDKDILVKNNKIYGPDTCCIVPARINYLFRCKNGNDKDLPKGIIKRKYPNKTKYRAVYNRCDNHKSYRINIGTFDSIEEAFAAYKEVKESYIKEVANQYKDSIPNNVYNALMEREVELSDDN